MEAGVAYANLVAPLNYILPTVACIFSTFNGASKTYDGYQIIRTNLTNSTGFDVVNQLFVSDSFDFLVPPSRTSPTDILVCPEQVNNLKNIFTFLNIPYDIVEANLQRKIEIEKRTNEESQRKQSGMTWTSYHRLGTINAWMDSMAEEYPALVSIIEYGRSSEDRPLRVMKISTGGVDPKPAVWMDGGIHAREWISPATVTYMANELILTATRGEQDFKMVDSFDWYIVPNLNPDGYEFSHTNDRMWRKTRSGDKSAFASLFGCAGVDPNRNFAYQWGGKGTSSNVCAQNYKGPKAASEPEVYHTQNFIYERKEQFKLFLTFHSYSQMLFTPWGYDEVPLEDREEMMAIADKAVSTLEGVHGTKYQAGSSPELLYPAAGGSEDWAKGTAGIKFAYCFELRDTGKNGFVLPPDQIIPSGQETYAAVRSMVADVKSYYKIGETTESPKN